MYWIIRLVSYKTQKYIRQCFVHRVHCYEVGLWIYRTHWKCCTFDYDSESCLVIRFLFFVEIDRYGFFEADTNISKNLKYCFLLHYQKM